MRTAKFELHMILHLALVYPAQTILCLYTTHTLDTHHGWGPDIPAMLDEPQRPTRKLCVYQDAIVRVR